VLVVTVAAAVLDATMEVTSGFWEVTVVVAILS